MTHDVISFRGRRSSHRRCIGCTFK